MKLSDERVLCVDDKQEIVELLHRQLADTYRCEFATSGADALKLIDANGPYAAIIADYSMPNMDGITLLGEVHQRAPDTVPIMLTAYGDIDVAIGALHQGNIFRFLRKPWETDELKNAIADALDQYHLIINERRLREELSATNAKLDAKVKELDETNRLLEYWVEFSPAVLYSLSVEHGALRPTYISKNFYQLTGNERTAMIVDPNYWAANLHPDDVERLHEATEALLNASEPTVSLEYRIRHKDGHYLSIVDSLRVIRNADGEPLEIVGCWTSASDRMTIQA